MQLDMMWVRGIDASINRKPVTVTVSDVNGIWDLLKCLCKIENDEDVLANSEDGRGRNFRIRHAKVRDAGNNDYVIVSKDIWELAQRHR